ncbi:MAG: FtsX-like permease family protein [Bacteroidetes bacterium]|nr:MAG: FtsX-like permease family protein [Bacteroidota bacterium]
MLRNYFNIALRNLLKNKASSLINVAGLSLGIAACLLITLYVWDELSHDRFHPNYSHIYRITEKQQQATGLFTVAVTPGPLAAALASDFPEIARTTRIGNWQGLLSYGTQSAEAEEMLIVDASFFQMFNFPLLAGNAETVFRSPDEVIVTEAFAIGFFGEDWRQKDVLGKVFAFGQGQTLTLVGVAKNPPAQSGIQFDVLLPFAYLDRYDEWSGKWSSNSYHTYIQLNPLADGSPADGAAFEQKIQKQLSVYHADTSTLMQLQPLSDIYLRSHFDFGTDWGKRGEIIYIRILAGVGLSVLLIAMINFINLATARASQRTREVGIRKTIGARRGGLVLQFWLEALLMTSVSLGVAILLAEILLPLLTLLSGKVLEIPYQNPLFVLGLLGLAALLSLLTGLYPAFVISAYRPAWTFRSEKKTGHSLRRSLVVLQFTLSVSLAISSLIMYQQLGYIQHTQLGFDQSHLMFLRIKGDLKGNASLLKAEMANVPGIDKVALATSNLVDVGNSSGIEWEGQTPGQELLVTQMNVDADFVPVTGLSLVTGRSFSTQNPADTSSLSAAYMINETAAAKMGWTPESALGKKVNFWGLPGVIIGVVKDFHFRPLRSSIEPFIFRFRPKEFYFTLLLKTEAGAGQATIENIASVYKKLDPVNPVSYGFVEEKLDAQYQSERRTAYVIMSFTALALLISCLGLLGLTLYTTDQRTKEIGIRKVLGASVASVVALLSADFLKLVLIAIVIASPLAAYLMHQWLQDFAYRIEIQWWMFAAVGLMAVAIAFLTVSAQSIRAAIANPVNSLRSE